MLFKLAIIEDNGLDQLSIMQLLDMWQEQSSRQLEVTCFEDSSKLLGAIDEAYGVFDAYLLDIGLREPQEGLTLARAIHSSDKEIPIVFISNRRELALDSYDVHAINFIAKPIAEVKFFATLDRITALLEKRSSDNFSYALGKSSKSIPLHQLLYLCTYAPDGHYLLINGEVKERFTMNLDDALAQFPLDLLRCHKSYIVNLMHLRQITPALAILSDGSEIPIGRVYLGSVRERFGAYHRITRRCS